MYCLFQADKTGKLNIDSMIKQIDMLMPEELIDRAKTACNACADLGKDLQ